MPFPRVAATEIRLRKQVSRNAGNEKLAKFTRVFELETIKKTGKSQNPHNARTASMFNTQFHLLSPSTGSNYGWGLFQIVFIH